MYSGKNVVLVVGLIVLIGVGAALSIWKAKTEEGNRRAAAEMTAKWQAQIDSLNLVVDSMRREAVPFDSSGTAKFIKRLLNGHDVLRQQIVRMAWTAQANSGLDTVSFLIRQLGDSTFYSYYGHYDDPPTWWIAPEELGMKGLPAIRPLIAHLDSVKGFELKQTLYALLLASQHKTTKAITKGDLPVDRAGGGDNRESVAAWKLGKTMGIQLIFLRPC
ncbi:MAG: hypothetical protein IPH75_10985 [bacterium]|nr:hypothetical protein [bacterium]